MAKLRVSASDLRELLGPDFDIPMAALERLSEVFEDALQRVIDQVRERSRFKGQRRLRLHLLQVDRLAALGADPVAALLKAPEGVLRHLQLAAQVDL